MDYISERTLQYYKKFHVEMQQWAEAPNTIPDELRSEYAMYFSGIFRNFAEFAALGMMKLGFKISRIQYDIAEFMQHGGLKRMVQDQRGQAKSTLAALYIIRRLS